MRRQPVSLDRRHRVFPSEALSCLDAPLSGRSFRVPCGAKDESADFMAISRLRPRSSDDCETLRNERRPRSVNGTAHGSRALAWTRSSARCREFLLLPGASRMRPRQGSQPERISNRQIRPRYMARSDRCWKDLTSYIGAASGFSRPHPPTACL